MKMTPFYVSETVVITFTSFVSKICNSHKTVLVLKVGKYQLCSEGIPINLKKLNIEQPKLIQWGIKTGLSVICPQL